MAGRTTEAEVIKKLATTPPAECNSDLKVGDIVTFTNEFDVVFEGMKIIGFAHDTSFHNRVVYTSGGAYWFPSPISAYTLEVKK